MQAFDGLGPEVINSRLSMLGFAIAAFFELTQGLDVFQQIKTYPLLTVATFVIFTSASWIPFLQGQSYNVKSGPFTPAVSGVNVWSTATWLRSNIYNVIPGNGELLELGLLAVLQSMHKELSEYELLLRAYGPAHQQRWNDLKSA